MITTTYDYSSGSGFLYDATKITFVGGMAELLLTSRPGIAFTPTISASTFDPTQLTYGSGALKQVDQRPATATYYAAWTSQLDANWSGPGAGSLTVTPSNGAAIAGGVLDLTGSTNKYVSFSGTGNVDNFASGTIEFQVIPNYSGAPGVNQFFCVVSESTSSLNNLIEIFHVGDGHLTIGMYDNSGTIIGSSSYAWSPVLGTAYTLCLKYTSGDITLSIDGSVVISLNSTYTRSGTIGNAIVGEQYNLSGGTNSNFSIKNMAFYSSVVTPASAVLSPTIYPLATANLPELTYTGLGHIQAFTNFVATDAAGVAYTLNGLYWNGSAWVASSGAYNQATSASAVLTNIGSLPASDTLQVNAIYPPGITQASLSALSATYTGQIFPITGPTIAPNSPLTMDALSDFVATITHPDSTLVKFYFLIGGTKYWWNGSAWTTSDGTAAQANVPAEIVAHMSTLPISLGAYVTPYAILYTPDGLSTPTLSTLMLTYDYFGPQPTGPNVCTVFGYIFDEKNNPVSGATITVTNPTTFINQGIVIAQGLRTATTDSIGYFSMTLVETATLSGAYPLTFDVQYTAAQVGTGFRSTSYSFGSADIPNTPEANITSLTWL